MSRGMLRARQNRSFIIYKHNRELYLNERPAVGKAVCAVYFGNNHSAVYHIKVDYHPFIKFLRTVFFRLFRILDRVR